MIDHLDWKAAVKEKKSNICAGLDPAEFEMGRGEKGLMAEADKMLWAIDYIRAVSPYVCAIKINNKYWLYDGHSLNHIYKEAKKLGLFVILDSKMADISDTNESEIFRHSVMGVDAVTIAPYAGNLEKTVEFCQKWDLSSFTMCLMSNPEFAQIKNSLHPVDELIYTGLAKDHIVYIDDVPHIPKYIKSILECTLYEATGIVIAATGHVTEKELRNIQYYSNTHVLKLCPGMGHQGGDVDLLKEIFPKENLIVNVSRGLMFPEGSSSTASDQAKAAKHFKELAYS